MKLGDILEKLDLGLRKYDVGTEVRRLALIVASDAYKEGYCNGANDALQSSIAAIDHVRGNLCIMSKIVGNGDLEGNQSATIAWATMDSIEKHVLENSLELTEEELH